MARIQVAVLALAIAAVVLFGLGYAIDPVPAPPAPHDGPGTPPGSRGADGRQRIALWNSESDAGRGPQGPRKDAPEREPARRRAALVVGGTGSTDDLGGGAARRRVGFLPDGVLDDDVAGSSQPAAELIAARAAGIPAAAPKAQASSDTDLPKRHVFELGDPNDAANRDLLLSVPFDGTTAAAKGDAPTVADGLVFDGDSVDFTNDAQVVFPATGNVRGAQGTISFSIDPHWAGADPTNNSLLQIRDQNEFANNLQIVKNLGALRFIIVDESGTESNVNVPITDWQPEQAHRIVATWDSGGMTLYLDGSQVGTADLAHGLHFGDTTPIHVGSDFAGGSYGGAGGAIKDLRVYGRALTPDEVG